MSRWRAPGRRSPLLPLLLTAGCAGVSVTRDGGPLPRTVAVLPFEGTADPRLRTLCRGLLAGGLRQRGVRVVETGHTDRILAEYGWLADPAAFASASVPADRACAALGVDAVLAGTGFAESSFNVLLLRRHAFAGSLCLRRGDGSTALQLEAAAARTGGFLLQSGQVLNELRDQGEHGTSRQAVALVDALVDDVLAVVDVGRDVAAGDRADGAAPAPDTGAGIAADAAPDLAAALAASVVRWQDAGAGRRRLLLAGAVPPGTRVWLDVDGVATGVPASERAGRFSVARDLDGDEAVGVVRLRARDGFGRTADREVRP